MTTRPAALLSFAALLAAGTGCDLLFLPTEELVTAPVSKVNIPAPPRPRAAPKTEGRLEAFPDPAELPRDPFLTVAEERERFMRDNPGLKPVVVPVKDPKRPRPSVTLVEQRIRDLAGEVPMIIIGEDGRRTAWFQNRAIQEGDVLFDDYVVERIRDLGITIGTTDRSWRKYFPFKLRPDENPWRTPTTGLED